MSDSCNKHKASQLIRYLLVGLSLASIGCVSSALPIDTVAGEMTTTSPLMTEEEIQTLTGYIAKFSCSEHFISHRSVRDYLSEDALQVLPLQSVESVSEALDVSVNKSEKSVLVRFGDAHSQALYREGLGCTLVLDRSIAQLQKERAPVALPDPHFDDRVWPEGSKVDLADLPEGVNRVVLEKAIDFAFAPTEKEGIDLNTRAVVIVYNGQIIGERYASGFDKNSVPYGASMSKSAANAILGLRVKDGELHLSTNRLLPEWQGADDPRSHITLDQLLRMSSGLAFDNGQTDSAVNDSIRMLYTAPDMAGYAAQFTLEAQPDTAYSYSNGTSNILMKILRQSFNGDDSAYWAYPRKRLFDKLGMRSALFETDTSGTFVGSSYLRATPRDWARLGLLYVRNGVWNGERLWPKDWVAYSTTPSSTLLDSTGTDRAPASYGAQIWLWPPFAANKPASHFYMGGDGGQFVTMLPKEELVIVRMGWRVLGQDFSQNGARLFDRAGMVERVLAALPNKCDEEDHQLDTGFQSTPVKTCKSTEAN